MQERQTPPRCTVPFAMSVSVFSAETPFRDGLGRGTKCDDDLRDVHVMQGSTAGLVLVWRAQLTRFLYDRLGLEVAAEVIAVGNSSEVCEILEWIPVVARDLDRCVLCGFKDREVVVYACALPYVPCAVPGKLNI